MPACDDVLGRVEVGLADAQADDVVHRGQDVEEAPDAGRRHLPDAPAQGPVGERHAVLGRAHACAPARAAARSAGVGCVGSSARASWAGSRPRQSAPALIAS